MCICLHVCVCTFLYALIGSPEPALAQRERAATFQSCGRSPPRLQGGGGNPQTSAAKVLNVEDSYRLSGLPSGSV